MQLQLGSFETGAKWSGAAQCTCRAQDHSRQTHVSCRTTAVSNRACHLTQRPWQAAKLQSLIRQPSNRRTRRMSRCASLPLAMVNVDFSPALLLGISMIAGGWLLYNVRVNRAYLSRDYDVVISSIAVLTGGILVFQGWRLDPLLLFGQLLTAGTAAAFALEVFRLRETIATRQGTEQQGSSSERWPASEQRWTNLTQQPSSLPAPDTDRPEPFWQDSMPQQDVQPASLEQQEAAVADDGYVYSSYSEDDRNTFVDDESSGQQQVSSRQGRNNSPPPIAAPPEDYRLWGRQVDFDSVEDW